MKMNTLEKLYLCLLYVKNEIILEKELMDRARIPLIRMLKESD